MAFAPPGVSRWYRYDWQYAVDVSRIPMLRPAALIISLMPLIISISDTLFPSIAGTIPLSLWLMWVASVSFVLAWGLLYIACPQFIREYRDFGQFKARQHSHRWIVWEFYNNLKSLSGWESIIRETSSKRLTSGMEDLSDGLVESLGVEFKAQAAKDLKVFKPVNVDRDIYLPIHRDGRRLVLAMREDDPQLDEKEKELFWILFTQAVKERPWHRRIYWFLVIVSILLVAANVIKNIALVFVHLRS